MQLIDCIFKTEPFTVWFPLQNNVFSIVNITQSWFSFCFCSCFFLVSWLLSLYWPLIVGVCEGMLGPLCSSSNQTSDLLHPPHAPNKNSSNKLAPSPSPRGWLLDLQLILCEALSSLPCIHSVITLCQFYVNSCISLLCYSHHHPSLSYQYLSPGLLYLHPNWSAPIFVTPSLSLHVVRMIF